MQAFIVSLLFIITCIASCNGFRVQSSWTKTSSMTTASLRADSSSEPTPSAPVPAPENTVAEVVKTKGFGKPKPPPEKKPEPEKDIGTQVYEKQAARGIPEYNIFLRPSNGTEQDWVPVGSMTIPRDTPVSRVVFEAESELLKGTFKIYPDLKFLYNKKKEEGETNIFEYGYCLKAFPDEQIKVVIKETENKNFFQNWLTSITNPLDTSELKNKGQATIRQ